MTREETIGELKILKENYWDDDDKDINSIFGE